MILLLAAVTLPWTVASDPATADRAPSATHVRHLYAIADDGPSATELWQAYPLHPRGAGRDAASEGGPATDAADTAPGSTGDGFAGTPDTRLMLQLGMLIAALYLAFIAVWFSATRGISRRIRAFGVGAQSRDPLTTVASAHLETDDRSLPRSTRSRPPAVWRCEIGWLTDRAPSRFCAVMAGPDGQEPRLIAESGGLPWPPRPGESVPTAQLVSDLERLVATLTAAGWEPAGSGVSWSARRFVWHGNGEPPASPGLVEAE